MNTRHLCTRCVRALHPKPSFRRNLHARIPTPPIPSPTPFVPDAPTFLALIGRGLSQYASKITSWNELFTLTSLQLKDLGVEPARTRRYLLKWRDKFRAGEFGVGGELTHVKDGVAEVRLVDVPVEEETTMPERGAGDGEGSVQRTVQPRFRATINRSPNVRSVIINVDPDNPPTTVLEIQQAAAFPVKSVTKAGVNSIKASHLEYIKGSNGRRGLLRVKEGLWEVKRGQKVDGGERRQAEVRAKKRAAKRKAEGAAGR